VISVERLMLGLLQVRGAILVNRFIGKWRITEMEQWDQDYIDLEEPGYFRFHKDGLDEFVTVQHILP